ncbi:MAG: outer membrane protein transport protein [Polyangiaceae bacterium]|nr:outer membrane protein transport protein [Polyangiaceae bacterium]
MTAAGAARASSGLESPDVGVPQLGRGGAWVARADDPLAAYMNPGTLATQATGVHLGVHLMFAESCYARKGPGGAPVPPSASSSDLIPAPGAPGGPDAEVCTEGGVFPNPQLAASLRVLDDLAIGLAVLGPHGVGTQEWPESVPYTSQLGGDTTQPAPQRYLVVTQDSVIIQPTLSVSYAFTPDLSAGAGFVWGVASIDVVNFSEGTSSEGGDDFNQHQDLRSRVQAKDYFIPGFVLGGLWSPSDRVDMGAWFKWQDAVRATADLRIESRYWTPAGTKNEDPCPGEPSDCNITDEKEAGTLKLQIPMEAKLGVRYHHPRARGPRPGSTLGAPEGAARRVRDPLSEDLFDIELDLTWANNSAVDTIEVRFKKGLPVRGTDVGFVPTNADVPHEWKDVIGVRLGGDFVALPGLLALRAGGFFETKGQEDEYLNLDFAAVGWKLGVGGGATVRVGPVDVSAAFQHTFYGAIDNGGDGAIKAVSGDLSTNNRSVQSVNGGRLESSLTEFGLSGTVRF